ncbi:PA3371 family protein [Pseudomonas sp. S9]|uniref:PA3371 family protein n=1 Tax=Pseudomonas sp. S9 TaxID=686578 RepID=UPI00025570FD|nr:PA3371 family protein [Pseudomonas sp. S9]
MSKTALGLLILTVLSGAVLLTDVFHGDQSSAVLKCTFALSFCASTVALALGRRIKFGPVLR